VPLEIAPKIDLRSCHSGRATENVGSTHLQIEVVVDEFTFLQRWQMGCKGAEHRAGAAGEIDDRERGQYG
jgi:hypothetical protein